LAPILNYLSRDPLEQESYVLDMDLFVQAAQQFAPGALLSQLEAMHAQMDTLFFWSLTEDGKRELGVSVL